MELPLKDQLALLDSDTTSAFAAGTRSYIASDSHNAQTVQATALGFLRVFADWHLARTTGDHELSWEKLLTAPENEPGAVVVLELDIHTLSKIRAVLNLLFLHLFRTACEVAASAAGCRLPRPLCVFLDDFPASVGRIPGCAEYFNTLRSRDCRLTVALQSSKQLLQYFTLGEADAISAAFSTRVYCTPVDTADAEAAARAGGLSTVVSVARAYRFNRAGQRRLVQETETPVVRPLMTPEEVRLSPDHFQYGRACTVFLPNTPPARVWVRPAFEVPEWVAAFAKVSRTARRKTLRETPLTYTPPAEAEASAGAPQPGLPAGITNTKGWTDQQVADKLTEVKKALDWENTTGSAKKWWEAFETENKTRTGLVLRLAEELKTRKATITEFFLAYVYSNTDNIQANLHYLDYTRLKKEEERKKKEAAAKAKAGS
jgi:type IV secretory pathway TraG/TraD family ATPase VirD4